MRSRYIAFLNSAQHLFKDLVVPADIKAIVRNIHLISNCTEIKAERFLEI
jgi:hypothetical protein